MRSATGDGSKSPKPTAGEGFVSALPAPATAGDDFTAGGLIGVLFETAGAGGPGEGWLEGVSSFGFGAPNGRMGFDGYLICPVVTYTQPHPWEGACARIGRQAVW
jgi:hypothetical protein